MAISISSKCLSFRAMPLSFFLQLYSIAIIYHYLYHQKYWKKKNKKTYKHLNLHSLDVLLKKKNFTEVPFGSPVSAGLGIAVVAVDASAAWRASFSTESCGRFGYFRLL